jgi:hypothetical protein
MLRCSLALTSIFIIKVDFPPNTDDLCHLDLIAMKTIFIDDTSFISAGNNLQKVADDSEKDLVINNI